VNEIAGVCGAVLAGARCAAGACTCRLRNGEDVAESKPPDPEHKRFEIRLGAAGGSATLDAPGVGQFSAGNDDACFYIDIVPGTVTNAVYVARASVPAEGFSPSLDIAEYGPRGPWWYDILDVRCEGPDRRCNRDGADAWSAAAKHRKRGRVDPCGSAVISRLAWDTSGGTGDRELGLFRDFTVRFTMDVKKFSTEFHPGAMECGGQ
jgi:hypothetical protein